MTNYIFSFGKMRHSGQHPDSDPYLIKMLVLDSGPLQYMAAWNRHPGVKGTYYDLRRRGKGLS
jgi:hypothetical protein